MNENYFKEETEKKNQNITENNPILCPLCAIHIILSRKVLSKMCLRMNTPVTNAKEFILSTKCGK
jgi:hypothetical protein